MLANLILGRRADRLEFPTVLGAGLHVPHVDAGRAASEPEQDARFLVLADGGGIRFQVQQEFECRQGRGARERVAQKMPAGHARGDANLHISILLTTVSG